MNKGIILIVVLILFSCAVNQQQYFHLEKKYVKSTDFNEKPEKFLMTKKDNALFVIDPDTGKTDSLSVFDGTVVFLDRRFEVTDYGDSIYFENFQFIYKWYFK